MAFGGRACSLTTVQCGATAPQRGSENSTKEVFNTLATSTHFGDVCTKNDRFWYSGLTQIRRASEGSAEPRIKMAIGDTHLGSERLPVVNRAACDSDRVVAANLYPDLEIAAVPRVYPRPSHCRRRWSAEQPCFDCRDQLGRWRHRRR